MKPGRTWGRQSCEAPAAGIQGSSTHSGGGSQDQKNAYMGATLNVRDKPDCPGALWHRHTHAHTAGVGLLAMPGGMLVPHSSSCHLPLRGTCGSGDNVTAGERETSVLGLCLLVALRVPILTGTETWAYVDGDAGGQVVGCSGLYQGAAQGDALVIHSALVLVPALMWEGLGAASAAWAHPCLDSRGWSQKAAQQHPEEHGDWHRGGDEDQDHPAGQPGVHRRQHQQQQLRRHVRHRGATGAGDPTAAPAT